jgi:hypothetical protein
MSDNGDSDERGEELPRMLQEPLLGAQLVQKSDSDGESDEGLYHG